MRMLAWDESKVTSTGAIGSAIRSALGRGASSAPRARATPARRGLGCAICSGGGRAPIILEAERWLSRAASRFLARKQGEGVLVRRAPMTQPGTGAAARRGGAAFFDLDKTLMEAAPRCTWTGRIPGGPISSARCRTSRQCPLRLQGSTDAATDALRARKCSVDRRPARVDLARLTPDVLRESCRRVPQMLDVAWRHQEPGGVYIVRPRAGDRRAAGSCTRVHGGIGARSEIRDGVYTGRPDGPFTYREGKAEAIRQSPPVRGSTWPSRTRTRTQSRIYRCSAP